MVNCWLVRIFYISLDFLQSFRRRTFFEESTVFRRNEPFRKIDIFQRISFRISDYFWINPIKPHKWHIIWRCVFMVTCNLRSKQLKKQNTQINFIWNQRISKAFINQLRRYRLAKAPFRNGIIFCNTVIYES